MKSRIRYRKTETDGVLRSVATLISNRNAKYSVILDTNNCTFSIVNLNTGKKYNGGDGVNNLHVLKRKVKSKLEYLGVSFGKEIRDNSSREAGVNCSYK